MHEKVVVGRDTYLNGQSQITQTDHGGTLGKPGRRGQGGKEKEWLGLVSDDLWMFWIRDGVGWETWHLNPANGAK